MTRTSSLEAFLLMMMFLAMMMAALLLLGPALQGGGGGIRYIQSLVRRDLAWIDELLLEDSVGG